MPKGKYRKYADCVYCGQSGRMTREHPVAQGFFDGPLPNDMITVPVCNPCNNQKSKDDDYLRDITVFDIACENNPTAQKILQEAVTRSMRKNRSHAAKDAIRTARREAEFTPSGLYTRDVYSFSVDWERINKNLSLMARGIYYALVGKLLPMDCKFRVTRVDSLSFAAHWEHLQKTGNDKLRRLGDDNFACIFMYATEENTVSHTWIWFYDSVCYLVTTCPSNFDIDTLKPVTT